MCGLSGQREVHHDLAMQVITVMVVVVFMMMVFIGMVVMVMVTLSVMMLSMIVRVLITLNVESRKCEWLICFKDVMPWICVYILAGTSASVKTAKGP